MKARPQSKEMSRPLRSSTKVPVKNPVAPPPVTKQKEPVSDLSILKNQIETTVNGPLDLLQVYEKGTPEVIELLRSECFVIFECKVCRNLFRSTANFITHKQSYCLGRFQNSDHLTNGKEMMEHGLLVGCNKGSMTGLRKTAKRDIISLLESFTKKNGEPLTSTSFNFLDVKGTNAAVYTKDSPPFKDPKNDISVLDKEGRVVGLSREGDSSAICRTCCQTFPSVQHLLIHSQTCSAVIKSCYGCPCCSKFFSSSWGVYRHLKKVHGKSNDQVRKLRTSVQKIDMPVVEAVKSKRHIPLPEENMTVIEKTWAEEVDNGTNKCFVCGKQFERRAALLSHTTACQKKRGNAMNIKRRPESPIKPEGEKRSRIEVRRFYDKPGGSKMKDEATQRTFPKASMTNTTSSANGDNMIIIEDDMDNGREAHAEYTNEQSSSDEGVDSPTIPCSPELSEAAPLVNGFTLSPEPVDDEGESLSEVVNLTDNIDSSSEVEISAYANESVLNNLHMMVNCNGTDLNGSFNSDTSGDNGEYSVINNKDNTLKNCNDLENNLVQNECGEIEFEEVPFESNYEKVYDSGKSTDRRRLSEVDDNPSEVDDNPSEVDDNPSEVDNNHCEINSEVNNEVVDIRINIDPEKSNNIEVVTRMSTLDNTDISNHEEIVSECESIKSIKTSEVNGYDNSVSQNEVCEDENEQNGTEKEYGENILSDKLYEKPTEKVLTEDAHVLDCETLDSDSCMLPSEDFVNGSNSLRDSERDSLEPTVTEVTIVYPDSLDDSEMSGTCPSLLTKCHIVGVDPRQADESPIDIKIYEPDSPEEDTTGFYSPIYLYISKEQKSCLICGKVFPKLNQAVKDVANHLGISRYRCAINSCSFKSYTKFDIQKHILLYHKIKKSNLYVLNVPREEMFSDNDSETEFLGFDVPGTLSPPEVYKQYLDVLDANQIQDIEIMSSQDCVSSISKMV